LTTGIPELRSIITTKAQIPRESGISLAMAFQGRQRRWMSECRGFLSGVCAIMLPTLRRELRRSVRRPVFGRDSSCTFDILAKAGRFSIRFFWRFPCLFAPARMLTVTDERQMTREPQWMSPSPSRSNHTPAACPTVRQRGCSADADNRGDNDGVGDSAGNARFSA
jgi:hypothetical protein